jgi:hypothetical protein
MTRKQQEIAVNFFRAISIAGASWSILILPLVYLITESDPNFKELAKVAPAPIFWLPLLSAAISIWLVNYIKAAMPRRSQEWSSVSRWKLISLAGILFLTIPLMRVYQEGEILKSDLWHAERNAEILEARLDSVKSRTAEEQNEMVACLDKNLDLLKQRVEDLRESGECRQEVMNCEREKMKLFVEAQVCRVWRDSRL